MTQLVPLMDGLRRCERAEAFPSRGGALPGVPGTAGLPAGGPISWEEMGKEPQREEVLPSGPLLWWGCVGEAVLLKGYPACGPHIGAGGPVTARPPAGRAGDVGGYPFGEKAGKPFGVS